MKVTWSWLAEFVEMDMPLARLVERLTLAGFEVEAVEQRGRDLSDVVCAEIVRVAPHPRADRLSVCEVRTGHDAAATVVCGATNMRAGDRVAYAKPGSMLPGGRQIGVAEIRGVASAGMLCSEAELALGTEASGILILSNDAPLGQRVAAFLGIEDTVLDIAVTPNRGDCLSVLGMAREIAALTGRRLRRHRPSVPESEGVATPDLIAIRIADSELCGRYVGRVVADVKIMPSPVWMQSRLQAVGLRPINDVVDVTNYVMIERGQPLHAFDYDRLPAKEIVVRRAGAEAPFTALDGQVYALKPGDLLITSGEEPVAIAGVIGGAATEVTSQTRRLLLESAWFAPGSVRSTGKRLGVRTEASYRFERGTDIGDVPYAADRAVALLGTLGAGAAARGRVDVYPSARHNAPIPLRLKRVGELLGTNISRVEVVSSLKALGLTVSPATRGTLTVVAPSYRSDLSREIDLVEEVARLGGYENVPATLPKCTVRGTGVGDHERHQRALKRLLTAQGLHEAVLLSFCSSRLNRLFPGLARHVPVTLLNPLTEDDAELRLSLLPGMVKTVRDNLDQGTKQVAVFSIGKAFWGDGAGGEGWRVAGALSHTLPGRGLGSRNAVTEFVDVKGVVESILDVLAARAARWVPARDLPAFHPGKTARVEIGGTPLGITGALHPTVQEELGVENTCWVFELDLDSLLQYRPRAVVYKELPRFPAVVRDLAVVSEESFASDEVVRFVRAWSTGSQWIEDVQLFDQYVGPPIPAGKKSLAYSISYRAPDRTLTDAEVNAMHAQLLAAVQGTLHVELR
ncbi:MAG: phenylalanine--tRNA ligase subunit beta [Candidatus Binatia bacterium]